MLQLQIFWHIYLFPLSALEQHKEAEHKAKFDIILYKTQKLGRTKLLAPST